MRGMLGTHDPTTQSPVVPDEQIEVVPVVVGDPTANVADPVSKMVLTTCGGVPICTSMYATVAVGAGAWWVVSGRTRGCVSHTREGEVVGGCSKMPLAPR